MDNDTVPATRRRPDVKQDKAAEGMGSKMAYTPSYNMGSNQAASREESSTVTFQITEGRELSAHSNAVWTNRACTLLMQG
jgi:hypothetical protein